LLLHDPALLIICNNIGCVRGQYGSIVGIGGIGYQLYSGFTGMPQIVIETSLKHNDQVRTAFPECFLYLVVVIQYLVDIEIVTGIQFVDDLPGGYIF
jgi:hypothetical protein